MLEIFRYSYESWWEMDIFEFLNKQIKYLLNQETDTI